MPTIDYEEIFHTAEVGIALNDPERGTVGLVNARYAEMLGYSPETLREMKIEEISAEDRSFDQDAAKERLQQALEGSTERFDWLFERKDGSQFWGEVVLKRTRLGEQDRLLAFVRDISARKRYEQELERQNERLEEFASIVSHDLRNPMGVALGRLELAKQDCDSDHLDEIEWAHRRMNALIEDILALARTGKSVMDIRPVELSNLAEACWGTIEVEPGTLQIESSVTLQADAPRLRQLLENLFRNAVVHNEVPVTVSVGHFADGFYVEDDGAGIPADIRENIFDAGYTTSDQGTGYGLRIVKQIVEAHGWEITVTTGEGGGARFEITGVDFE